MRKISHLLAFFAKSAAVRSSAFGGPMSRSPEKPVLPPIADAAISVALRPPAWRRQEQQQGERRMFLSRRAVLKGSTAAAVLGGVGAPLVARAQSAEFSYKYANNLPDSHPLNTRAKEMAAAIKAETNGRFDLQIFPYNQLGSDTDMLSQIRSGGIEFFTLSGLILSTLVPAASINGIGFAFPDYDTVWKAMDGDLGGYVRGEISKAGLVVMDKIWDNGFRQTTSSSKPINGPEDFKGFKIRVPVSPLWTSMFKAFDAAPASINFSEVYSALQTKVVEGQENPLAIISTAKLYEVQKFCSLTNHMWDGFWFLANRRAWDAVPLDVRATVAKHINAAAVNERDDVAKLNASLKEDLAGKGLAFNQPAVAPFREKLRSAGFYAEWKGRYGDQAWELLEKAVGKLS
jgi:TRAP-type transport system periplasmic protein